MSCRTPARFVQAGVPDLLLLDMKRLLFFVILIAMALTAAKSVNTDLPKSAWKKIAKEWAKLWPDQEVVKEVIAVPEEVNNKLSQNVVPESLYRLKIGDERVGYMFIAKAPSRYDLFDYMVIYNPDLTIKSTKILIYREDWGAEIGSVRWLKQFIGLSANDKIQVDHDIQGISGATISCQSATQGIRKLTKVMDELKKHGVIN